MVVEGAASGGDAAACGAGLAVMEAAVAAAAKALEAFVAGGLHGLQTPLRSRLSGRPQR